MQSINFRNLVGRRRVAEATGYNRVELVATDDALAQSQIASVIVSRMLGAYSHVLEEQTREPARLHAGGSTLHLARRGDAVWCAGLGDGSMPAAACEALDVRAVRGPVTADWLERNGVRAPTIFGNPILLLPALLPGRFRASGRRPYVVVGEPEEVPGAAVRAGLVSSKAPWNAYVESIVEASFVASATIEGLAVAEAFGIPARHLDGEGRNALQLDDYVLGTGRRHQASGRSIQEALEMGGMDRPEMDGQALLDAFPLDLWRDGQGAMNDGAAS